MGRFFKSLSLCNIHTQSHWQCKDVSNENIHDRLMRLPIKSIHTESFYSSKRSMPRRRKEYFIKLPYILENSLEYILRLSTIDWWWLSIKSRISQYDNQFLHGRSDYRLRINVIAQTLYLAQINFDLSIFKYLHFCDLYCKHHNIHKCITYNVAEIFILYFVWFKK